MVPDKAQGIVLRTYAYSETSCIATVFTRKGNDLHLTIVSRFDSFDNVFRTTAGGDGQQNITLITQCADLLGEDFVIAVVVSNRSHC